MNLEKEIFEIAIEDLVPNRFQPREKFDDESLGELSQSIKEHGVIQPIIVRKVGDKYEIVAGERRYRASKLAGKTTIPALIRNIDDKESAKIALLENLQRKNLTPIEVARTYQTILKLDNLTQEELAKNLGISQSTIANKIRLLNLSPEIQQALLDEKISERHARSLLNIEDLATQNEYLEKIIQQRLTVKQLDDEIATLTGKAIETNEEPIVEKEVNLFSNQKDIANAIYEPVKEEQQAEAPNSFENSNIFEKFRENQQEEKSVPSIELPSEEKISEPQLKEPTILDVKNDLIETDSNYVMEEAVESPIIEDPINNTTQDSLTYVQPEAIEPKEEDKVFSAYDNIEKPSEDNKIFSAYDNIEKILAKSPTDPITPVVENSMLKEETKSIPTNMTIDRPMVEQKAEEQTYDMRFAINNFRQAVQNTTKFGFNVEVEEFDFDRVYQIVIKIDKK